MKRILKKIAKQVLKKEVTELYWKFEELDSKIDKLKIHKPSREIMARATSETRKAFLRVL